MERGTATAHSDTIRTTDLIPSCPSTHTFNLLGRLEESLVRCLSDLIFLAQGPTVSANVNVCMCVHTNPSHVEMSYLACYCTGYSPIHWPFRAITKLREEEDDTGQK